MDVLPQASTDQIRDRGNRACSAKTHGMRNEINARKECIFFLALLASDRRQNELFMS
jgi:hypothetical protein